MGMLALPSVTLDFAGFTSEEGSLEASEQFRVYGPGFKGSGNASLAQDIEPEYLAVSADSLTAWVTLQENNGLARINLGSAPSVEWIHGLGLQDYGLAANATDTKDDGLDLVTTHPGLKGFFLPDGIARLTVDGTDYLLLANEGDLREYPGFNEEGLVENTGDSKNVVLDTATFDGTAKDALSGMSVTRFPFSPVAVTNPVNALLNFGGRSFSVRSGASGALLWDSGRLLDDEARAQGVYEEERSDEKSSEPESVTVGWLGTTPLAFVGLEKASSVAIFDMSNPTTPTLRQWLYRSGDVGPEGLLFVAANESPSGKDLLVTSNEKSGTLSVWQAGDDGQFLWTSTRDLGKVGASEITAYAPSSRRLFTVCNDEPSRIEVTALGSDLSLTPAGTLVIENLGLGVNSVAVHGGFVAAAIEGFEKTEPGLVAVWDTQTLKLVAKAKTGALPDMVTFTPDGTKILTADEGEPSLDYAVDPVGSVTIIDARTLKKEWERPTRGRSP